MFIAGSEAQTQAQLAGKLHLWAALSPVSYLKHSRSILLSVLAELHIGEW